MHFSCSSLSWGGFFSRGFSSFSFSSPTQYKLDFSGLAGRAASGGARDEDGSSGLQEGKGTTSSTEASM